MPASTTDRPRWRGRPLDGPEEATLAQRLGRRGVPILQRSIRYHRPRAPFCGVGDCTNCLVRVNGVPNTRSCRYVPAAGDRAESENSWPSPRWDLLGVLDRLFPRGLDTLHGFTRPAFAAPLYHRVVRRLAGFGRLPRAGDVASAPPLPEGRPLETDALVIGAGDGGRAAAARLLERGVATLVVDAGTPAGFDAVGLLPRTTAVFLPPPAGSPARFAALVHTAGGPARVVRARRVVVATGSYDGPLLFANGDRPGVLTAAGALALVPPGGGAWTHKAVLFGGGPRVVPVLEHLGAAVEAIVAPGPVGPEVVERASRLEVPIYPRTLLLGAVGTRRLRALRLVPRGGGAPFSLEADALVLAHRRLPQPQLFYQAGARMRWHTAIGAYLPEGAEAGATTVPGLFAAGSVAGFADPRDATSSGIVAAEAALGAPRIGALGAAEPAATPGELEGYYAELLAAPRGRGKWLICPCEDVLLREVEAAVRRGYHGVEVVKRVTGVGTGLCQGRYCLPDLLLLLARLEGRRPEEVGYITQRPPVRPTPLAALARAAPPAPEGPT